MKKRYRLGRIKDNDDITASWRNIIVILDEDNQNANKVQCYPVNLAGGSPHMLRKDFFDYMDNWVTGIDEAREMFNENL